MKEMNKILSSKLEEVKPSEEEMEKIREETQDIMDRIKAVIKRNRVKAEVFLGGSLAKNTLIRKDKYDVDIFVRFDKSYEDDKISEKLEEILKKAKLEAERVHGSRDYFRLNKKDLFEIIPTLKIKKPEEAKNVTDLSYFHVAYVLNCVKKKKKIGDEIIIAKAFCYAQKCYGAESYVKGFSGYSLELLMCRYKSFLNFIKAVAKAEKQIVLDPGRFYKNKDEILLNLNEAKLQSPIVFVDPTFKERNALAALSKETFSRFQESCRKFLKNPREKFFEIQKIDDRKYNLIMEAKTNKQEGDIAGSKLLKFFKFVEKKAEKLFVLKNSEFEYDGEKDGRYYFKLAERKEIILQGPPINKVENLIKFKQAHKDVFIKDGKAYAREKVKINLDNFRDMIRKNDGKVMEDMGITGLRIID